MVLKFSISKLSATIAPLCLEEKKKKKQHNLILVKLSQGQESHQHSKAKFYFYLNTLRWASKMAIIRIQKWIPNNT